MKPENEWSQVAYLLKIDDFIDIFITFLLYNALLKL